MLFHRKVGNGPKKSGAKTVYPNSGFSGKMSPASHPSKIDKVTIYHEHPSISLRFRSLLKINATTDDIETKKYEISKTNHIRIALNVFSYDMSAQAGMKQLIAEEGKQMAEQSVLGQLLMHYGESETVPLLDASIRMAIREFLDKLEAEQAPSFFSARL